MANRSKISINLKVSKAVEKQWIRYYPSNRSFATAHDIDEKTVRRILSDESYSMTIETLEKICSAEGMKLSDFFKLINR